MHTPTSLRVRQGWAIEAHSSFAIISIRFMPDRRQPALARKRWNDSARRQQEEEKSRRTRKEQLQTLVDSVLWVYFIFDFRIGLPHRCWRFVVLGVEICESLVESFFCSRSCDGFFYRVKEAKKKEEKVLKYQAKKKRERVFQRVRLGENQTFSFSR